MTQLRVSPEIRAAALVQSMIDFVDDPRFDPENLPVGSFSPAEADVLHGLVTQDLLDLGFSPAAFEIDSPNATPNDSDHPHVYINVKVTGPKPLVESLVARWECAVEHGTFEVNASSITLPYVDQYEPEIRHIAN